MNFALFSQHASSVTLCLFDAATNKPLGELPLDAAAHKTGKQAAPAASALAHAAHHVNHVLNLRFCPARILC